MKQCTIPHHRHVSHDLNSVLSIYCFTETPSIRLPSPTLFFLYIIMIMFLTILSNLSSNILKIALICKFWKYVSLKCIPLITWRRWWGSQKNGLASVLWSGVQWSMSPVSAFEKFSYGKGIITIILTTSYIRLCVSAYYFINCKSFGRKYEGIKSGSPCFQGLRPFIYWRCQTFINGQT